MGTAEIHPEDPFFPAAAAVLIEHCLEQQGFPPLTSYYDERRSLYLPELLLPGCLHTQVKHLVQVFRLSLQWGGQDHNSCVRRAGLEVGGGLPPIQLGHQHTAQHLLCTAPRGSSSQGRGRRGRGQGLLSDCSGISLSTREGCPRAGHAEGH